MDDAARANWKGVLKIGEVSCPVALYAAASTAERIAFHILNRKTGHRVHRELVDSETGKRVESKDQIKGYETGPGDYIPFEPEEVAKAVPEVDKTLDVQAFVPCDTPEPRRACAPAPRPAPLSAGGRPSPPARRGRRSA
jgi:DNA end-binding protein Ku